MNKAVYRFLIENPIFWRKDLIRHLVLQGYGVWLAVYWIKKLRSQGILEKVSKGIYKVDTRLLKQKYPYMEEVIKIG